MRLRCMPDRTIPEELTDVPGDTPPAVGNNTNGYERRRALQSVQRASCVAKARLKLVLPPVDDVVNVGPTQEDQAQ